MLKRFLKAIAYDQSIWRRGWRLEYSWLRPCGYGWFRFKFDVRDFMPYPGIYLILKMGSVQHCISLGATFKFQPSLVFRANELGMEPYQLAGHTESC